YCTGRAFYLKQNKETKITLPVYKYVYKEPPEPALSVESKFQPDQKYHDLSDHRVLCFPERVRLLHRDRLVLCLSHQLVHVHATDLYQPVYLDSPPTREE